MQKDGRKVYKYFGSVRAKFLQNYDGDTFKCDIDAWPVVIGQYISIRIADIDAPEMYKGDTEQNMFAERSRIALYEILASAFEINLTRIRRGKYFRLIATVFADNVNVGDKMVRDGYAIKTKGPE